MLINIKMPTFFLHFNIYKHDKYNLCQFESKGSLSFSAFELFLTVVIPCSVELNMEKVL